jgi:hypothetical protein
MDAIGDPSMQPVPAVRAQKAERLRVLSAEEDEIRITQLLVSKGSVRVGRERDTVAAVERAIATCAERATTANERERDAWLLGERHLRDGSGHEIPGAIVALCREWKVDRLPPLPNAQEQLARAEADLAPHAERLRAAVERWDRPVVHVAIDATLPAVESEMPRR